MAERYMYIAFGYIAVAGTIALFSLGWVLSITNAVGAIIFGGLSIYHWRKEENNKGGWHQIKIGYSFDAC